MNTSHCAAQEMDTFCLFKTQRVHAETREESNSLVLPEQATEIHQAIHPSEVKTYSISSALQWLRREEQTQKQTHLLVSSRCQSQDILVQVSTPETKEKLSVSDSC